MSHTVVTLELSPTEKVDLALPLNVPNHALAPALAKSLELSAKKGKDFLLAVKTEDGIVRLSRDTTLGEAGVLDGFILTFHLQDGAAPVEKEQGGAFLQAESGERFLLDSGAISIGRRDVKRGILVDIDLTPFDVGKIISRKHALIERRQEVFVLIDQGSVNGTWLNNERLEPKQEYALKKGDSLVFGRNGVNMTFNQH